MNDRPAESRPGSWQGIPGKPTTQHSDTGRLRGQPPAHPGLPAASFRASHVHFSTTRRKTLSRTFFAFPIAVALGVTLGLSGLLNPASESSKVLPVLAQGCTHAANWICVPTSATRRLP